MSRVLTILFLLCLTGLAAPAPLRIWELPNELITPSADDVLIIGDMAGPTTKKITFGNLTAGITGSAVWPVAGDNITAVTNGLTVTLSAAAGGGGGTNKTLFVYDISTNEIPAESVTNAGNLIFHNINEVIVPAQLGSAAYRDIETWVISPTNFSANGDIIQRTATNNKWVSPLSVVQPLLPALNVITQNHSVLVTLSNDLQVIGAITASDGSIVLATGGDISTSGTVSATGVTANAGGVNIEGGALSLNGGPVITTTGDATFNTASFASGAVTVASDGVVLYPHGGIATTGAAIFVDGAVILDGLGITAANLVGTGDRLVQVDSLGHQTATIDVASLGVGTVTSVGASGPAGFTWSAAVTGAGTLTATTPGPVLTNGHNQAITLSNVVTIRGSAADGVLLVSNAAAVGRSGIVSTGSTNDFFQFKVKNYSNGDAASSDVVAEADNGSETTYYVNMGINGSKYNQPNFVGLTNDCYFYGSGSNVWVGSISPNTLLNLFTGSPTNVIASLSTNTFTVKSNAVIDRNITVTGNVTNSVLTANTVVITDANKALKSVANGGAGTYLDGSTPPAYSTPPGLRTWAGTTGNALIAAAATAFYAPNGNSHTNVQGSDTATFTRNLVTRSTTLTNLYCKLSAAPGASRDCTIVVMTNGVASNLQTVVSAAATTGNSTTLSVPISAGDEFGIRITTVASATATKISWALEGR